VPARPCRPTSDVLVAANAAGLFVEVVRLERRRCREAVPVRGATPALRQRDDRRAPPVPGLERGCEGERAEPVGERVLELVARQRRQRLVPDWLGWLPRLSVEASPRSVSA
jgi:hypothetical protein